MTSSEAAWRGAATRLVADVQMVTRELTTDVTPPSPAAADELVRATHYLIDALTKANIIIGRVYGEQLPTAVLDHYRTAVRHMQSVRLIPVADALSRLNAGDQMGTTRPKRS